MHAAIVTGVSRGLGEARRELLEVGLGDGGHTVPARLLVAGRILGQGRGRGAQEERGQGTVASQGNLTGTAS